MDNEPNSKCGMTISQYLTECDIDEAVVEFSSIRRSIRIHGHSTTIRLENAFWKTLEELAEKDNMSLVDLITSIQDHCPQIDTRNLASCLRVLCLRYSGN